MPGTDPFLTYVENTREGVDLKKALDNRSQELSDLDLRWRDAQGNPLEKLPEPPPPPMMSDEGDFGVNAPSKKYWNPKGGISDTPTFGPSISTLGKGALEAVPSHVAKKRMMSGKYITPEEETSFIESAKKGIETVPSFLKQGLAGLVRFTGDTGMASAVAGPEEGSQDPNWQAQVAGQEMFREGRKEIESTLPDVEPGSLKAHVYGAAQSLGLSTAAFTTGVLTGSTLPLLALATASGAQEYGAQREGGSDVGTAILGAVVNGLAEYWGERLPFAAWSKAPGYFEKMVASSLMDSVGELGTQAVQSAVQKFTYEPGMTWDDFTKTMQDTLIQSLMAGGVQTGAIGAVQATQKTDVGARSLKEYVEQNFQGSKVDLTGHGANVTLPSGRTVEIHTADSPMAPELSKAVEEGAKKKGIDTKETAISGVYWRSGLLVGTENDLIYLTGQMTDTTTLPHEKGHLIVEVLRDVMTPQELEAIGLPATGAIDPNLEEDVMKTFEEYAYSRTPSLENPMSLLDKAYQKVIDFAHEIYTAFGGATTQRQVFEQMRTGKILQREGAVRIPGESDEAFQVRTVRPEWHGEDVKTKSGQIIGAPGSHLSHQAREGLIRKMVRVAVGMQKINPEQGQWYEKSGEDVRRLFGLTQKEDGTWQGNIEGADQFLRAIAAWSPQAGVERNVEDAIAVLHQIARGEEVNTSGTVTSAQEMARRFSEISSAPEVTGDLRGLGPKAVSFYWDLHNATFKVRDAVNTTIDRHIIGAFDLASRTGRPMEALKPMQYRWANNVMREVTARFNKETGLDLDPRNVQAMIWAWQRQGRMFEESKVDHIGSHLGIGIVTGEIVPATNSDVTPWIHEQNYGVKQGLSDFVTGRVLYDKNGRNVILDRIQSPQGGGVRGIGTYEGAVNPNVITTMMLQNFAPEMANLYADLFGYIFTQNAVPWYRADRSLNGVEGKTQGYAIARLDGPITDSLVRSFYDILKTKMPSGELTFLGDEIHVINFMGLDQAEFDAKIREVGLEWAKANDVEGRRWQFGTEGDYRTSDPEGAEKWTGDLYRRRILAAGSPALFEWADRQRASALEAAREYSEQVAPPGAKFQGKKRVDSRQVVTLTDIHGKDITPAVKAVLSRAGEPVNTVLTSDRIWLTFDGKSIGVPYIHQAVVDNAVALATSEPIGKRIHYEDFGAATQSIRFHGTQTTMPPWDIPGGYEPSLNFEVFGPITDKQLEIIEKSVGRNKKILVDLTTHEGVGITYVEGRGPAGVKALKDAIHKAYIEEGRFQSRKIGWSDKRIKSMIETYAYAGGETKGLLGWVSPQDFLDSTSHKETQERVKRNAGSLDVDQLRKEGQTPYLTVEKQEDGTFKIKNHEGRHRLVAMMKEGIDQVPIVIRTPFNRSDYAGVQEMTLGAEYDDLPGITVKEMIPLTYGNDGKIRAAMDRNGLLFQTKTIQTPAGEFPLEHNGWKYEGEMMGLYQYSKVLPDSPLKATFYVKTPDQVEAKAIAKEKEFAAGKMQTKEFEKWFAGSKAVDENGKPIVAYHGTTLGFESFATRQSMKGSGGNGNWLGKLGSWFSAASNREGDIEYEPGNAEYIAESFITGKDDEYKKGGRIIPVNLSIKNPMVYYDYEELADDVATVPGGAEVFRNRLKKQGYDGIHIQGSMTDGNVYRDDWVAFEPEQIKSIFNQRPILSGAMFQSRPRTPGPKGLTVNFTDPEVTALGEELLRGSFEKLQFTQTNDQSLQKAKDLIAAGKMNLATFMNHDPYTAWPDTAHQVAAEHIAGGVFDWVKEQIAAWKDGLITADEARKARMIGMASVAQWYLPQSEVGRMLQARQLAVTPESLPIRDVMEEQMAFETDLQEMIDKGLITPEQELDAMDRFYSIDAAQNFARRVAKKKVKDVSVLNQLFYFSLLSNPVTQAANIVGNMGPLFFAIADQYVSEKNPFNSTPKGGTAGMMAGLYHSVLEAFILAGRAGYTGESSMKGDKFRNPRLTGIDSVDQARNWIQKTMEDKTDPYHDRSHPDHKQAVRDMVQMHRMAYNPISGDRMERASSGRMDSDGPLGRTLDVLGEFIDSPFKGLAAGDEFFKVINQRMWIWKSAYEMATENKLEGKAFNDFVAQYVDDPPEKTVKLAEDFAAKQTFTSELGPIAEVFQTWNREYPAFRLVVPFVTVIGNIVKYNLEHTPFAYAFRQVRADISKPGPARDMALSKMAVGSSMMLAFAGLAAAGLITGGGPSDPKLKKLWSQPDSNGNVAWQEYSFKVGKKWVSYKRIEPFATPVGVAADLVEILKFAPRFEITEAFIGGAIAFTRNFTSKTYAQGISNFLEAITSGGGDTMQGNAGRWIKSTLGMAVPGVVAQVARVADPVKRDVDGWIDRLKSRIPGLSMSLEPQRNLKGDVMTVGMYESIPGKGLGMVNPFMYAGTTDDVVTREIIRNRVPLTMPSRSLGGGMNPDAAMFDEKDTSIHLTPEQYGWFVKMAGNGLKDPKTGRGAWDTMTAIINGIEPVIPAMQGKRAIYYNDKNSDGIPVFSDGPEGGKAAILEKVVHNYRNRVRDMIEKGDVFPAVRNEYIAKSIGKKINRAPQVGGAR